MFTLNRPEAFLDSFVMTHRCEADGATAMVVCRQQTSGMMMGDRWAVLVHYPRQDGGAEAEYPFSVRGDEAARKCEQWMKDNGFRPWRRPMTDAPFQVGQRVRGNAERLSWKPRREVEGVVAEVAVGDDGWTVRLEEPSWMWIVDPVAL